MKFSSILSSSILAGLCYIQTASTSPIGLQKRATTNNVIVGYFPNWLYSRYTPAMIDFTKYTHIYYAFAIQNTGGVPTWSDSGVLEADVSYGFPTLVKLAHAAGTKVMVSVGGWSGSTEYSLAASSSTNRQTFINWIVSFIQQYGTDGVDLDWEYPTSTGAGCNAVNANDVENFNTLVKEIRSAFDTSFPNEHKEITMAVHITPFGGATPVADVSGFIPYVDRFHVMAFDVNGAWNSTSGPNAPFHNTPGYGYPAGFVEGIQSWHAAGVPYAQIAGGVAFYGRVQTLTVTSDPTTQYNPGVSPNPPAGDSLDGYWQDAYCSSDTETDSGVWRYSYMRSEGLLSGPTTAVSPWVRHFDNVTQTPWLYNPTNKQYISYDDTVSLGVKADYALSTGLAGLFVWSVDEDNGELLGSIAKVIAGNPSRTAITTGTATATATATASTTTKTTGTATTTTASPTSSASCSGISAWSATTTYVAGNEVTYDNDLFQANWWTLGDTPSATASYAPWKYISAC